MKKLKNKKGFTLIELLAVIVVLAIIMVIATTAVLPTMEKARKNSLAIEANSLVKAAQQKYGVDMLTGGANGTNACYSMEQLKDGYYQKNDESYHGSVQILISGNSYTYKVWISNGTYIINGVEPDATAEDAVPFGGQANADCTDANING